MRAIVSSLLIAGAIITSAPSVATDKMYGVISGGFADSDFSDSSADGVSYKLALGHQFHPQWYVEGGYQRIANESIDSGTAGALDVLEGDALFISALGKAGSREGELFYRVGVLRADLQGFECADSDCLTLNEYDNGAFDGVIGLGYDWYVGLNSMVRFEIEHIAGEDNLQVSAAYIGFRYNFN